MADNQITWDINPSSILAAIAKVNKNLDQMEQKGDQAVGGLRKDFEGLTSTFLKLNDRSYQATERLTKSIERQAAAYGKTGVDRLIADRDRHIRQLGNEESQIKRVTAAYDAMIAKERQIGTGSASSGHGSAARTAFLGAKDIFEGRGTYATVEFAKTLQTLQGLPAVAGTVAAGLGAIALSGVSAASAVAEYAHEQEILSAKTGLSIEQSQLFSRSAKITGTDVSSLTTQMRGLARALAEGSDEGRKAKAALKELGLDDSLAFQSPDRALTAIYAKLGGKSSFDQERIVSTLFGKGGIESLPMAKDLRDLSVQIRAAGGVIEEDGIRKAAQYERELSLLGVQWDSLKMKLGVKAVGVIEFIAKTEGAASSGDRALTLENIGTTLAGFLPNGELIKFAAEAYRSQKRPDSVGSLAGLLPGTFTPGVADPVLLGQQYQSGDIRYYLEHSAGGGKAGELLALQRQLQNAETDLAAAIDRRELKSVKAANENVISLKNQIQELGKIESITERIQKLSEEQGLKNKYPYGLLASDQKLLDLATTPGITAAQIKQVSGILGPERAKEARDAFQKGIAQGKIGLAREMRGEGGELFARDSEFERQRSEVLRLMRSGGNEAQTPEYRDAVDQLRRTAGDQVVKDDRPLAEILNQRRAIADRNFTENLQRENRELEKMAQPQGGAIQADNSLKLAQGEGAIRIGGILGGPRAELQAAAQLATLKIDSLNDQYRFEKDLIQAQYGLDASLEDRKTEARLRHEHEIFDVQIQLDEQVAQKQRQQLDEIKTTAQGLLTTLFTSPSKFGGQLLGTLRAAALRPVTEGLSSIVADKLHPYIFGKDGQSGIAGTLRSTFGGKLEQANHLGDVSLINGAVPVVIQGMSNGSSGNSRSWSMPQMARIPALGLGLAGLFGGGGFATAASSVPAGIVQSSINFGDGAAATGPGQFFGSGSSLSDVVGGPGGTSGFAGAVPGYGGGGAGGGIGQAGGILGSLKGGIGGLKGILSQLGGIGQASGGRAATGAAGGPLAQAGFGGVAGGAMLLGGGALAFDGLRRGGWAGVGETTAGGALIGAKFGGPLGAAIGAGIGFAAGMIRLAFESQVDEAKKLVWKTYGVKVDTAMAKQIVQIAKQSYSGHVSMAVRSPEVRQLIELFAAGTGRKVPLSNTTPRGASLIEQGGTLYQTPQSVYGQQFVQGSTLPIMGGSQGVGMFPTSVVLNVNGQSAADLLEGRISNTVNPGYVQNQFAAAQQGSNGRLNNSAMLQAPGLVVS